MSENGFGGKIMSDNKKSGCEGCAFRKKAEAKPKSIIGIVWKLHTYICPGWRAYQKSLSFQD
jgi:hypothetical protein